MIPPFYRHRLRAKARGNGRQHHKGPAVLVPTTFSGSDLSANVARSNGNLTVTYSGTTTDAAARCTTYRGAGKRYIEFTIGAITGGDAGVGISRSDSALATLANVSSAGSIDYKSGNIWSNGVNSTKALAALAAADVIGIAVDIDNQLIWFRKAPSGNWNGDVSANPATGAVGVALPAIVGGFTPAATFGGGGASAGDNFTLNSSSSGLTGAVPSGFVAGW